MTVPTCCHVHLTPAALWHESVVGDLRIWTRGAAFFGDRHLDSAQLARMVGLHCSAQGPEATFSELLQRLNGFFALVVQGDGWLAAAVDRVRSIPLLYSQSDGQVRVSSDGLWLLEAGREKSLDPVSVLEFAILGYTTGAHTLSASVKQLVAGQWLLADMRGTSPVVNVSNYSLWKHVAPGEATEDELQAQGDEALTRAFGRLIEHAGRRQIVVPLSGGLDSRLVVTMLRRCGCEHVLCFSYGVPGNHEAELSRQVAESLGYPWVFVPYSRDLWKSWYASDEWRAYATYCGGINVKPHLQDWPAVWCLREQGLVAPDAVFAPGHLVPQSAKSDVLPRVYTSDPANANAIIDAIYHIHYALQRPRGSWRHPSPEIRLRILAALGDLSLYVDSADAFEAWELCERESKFIINSVRVYESWGYDWWLPLLDRDLMDFWARVPRAYRQRRRLHHRIIRRLYAATAGDRAVTATVAVSRRQGRLAALLRHSVLAPVYRLAIRIPLYWTEPRAWFGIVSPWEYLRTMLEVDTLAAPGSGVNTFLVRDQLALVRERQVRRSVGEGGGHG